MTMSPNITLSTPEPPKPRVLPPVKPPRIIIEHFDLSSYKIDQAHGYVEADCQHCGATIKGQKNVTSNFIQHMRRRHPDAYEIFSKSSTQRSKRPRLLTPTPAKSAPSQATVTPPATAPFTPTAHASSASPLPLPIHHSISDPTNVAPPIRPTLRSHLFADPCNSNRSDIVLETALVSATYRGAERTPCNLAQSLSLKTSCQIYLKREDLQVAGSPVFRAAYNYLAAIPTARGGVLAAADTALPVAVAANKHAKPCHVVIPACTPAALLKKLAKYDAKFDVTGRTFAECAARAAVKAAEMNRTYVDVAGPKLRAGCEDAVAGYATLALELLQQCPHADRVFIAGGNALLFSGVSAVLQRLGRGVKLIGVVLDARCDDADISGASVLEEGGKAAQAAAQQPIQEDWAAFTEDVVRVGRAEMCAGVRAVFQDCDGCLLEPMGALSVAGAVKYVRVHKLSHERVAAVVETPLRSFEKLEMITRWSGRADESRCVLCVHRKNEGDAHGASNELSTFVHELGGTVGGRVKVKSLRFGGKWPLLLGLGCDQMTTAAMHLANLTSLGYSATDVTGSDLAEDELWTWGEDDAGEGEGERDADWGVFRVEVALNGVTEFLAVERAEVALRKVSYNDDGNGVGRIALAAKGTEVQLGNLEKEMRECALCVRRLQGELNGLKVLGCGGRGIRKVENRIERGETERSNGEVAMETCEVVERENGSGVIGMSMDGGEGAGTAEGEDGEDGGGGGSGGGEGGGDREGEEEGEGGGKEVLTDGRLVFTEVSSGEPVEEGGEAEVVHVAEDEEEGEREAEGENETADIGEAEAEGTGEVKGAMTREVTSEEVNMEVEAGSREQAGVDGVGGGEISGNGDGVEGGGEEVEVVGECVGEVEEHEEVEHGLEIGEGEEVMAEGDQV